MLIPVAVKAADDEVVIAAWHPWVKEEQDRMLEDFREANPDINVEFDHIPWAGSVNYLETITTRAVGGVLADVVAVPHQMVPETVSMGIFRDLRPFIDRDPDAAQMDDLLPAFVDAITFNGHVMGFPYDSSAMWVNYNKVAFEERGLVSPLALVDDDDWHLSDMMLLAKKLTEVDKDGNIRRSGIGAMAALNEGYTAWLWANGGHVMKDGFVDLNIPENIEMVTRMKEMLDQHELRWGWGSSPVTDVGMLIWHSGIITHIQHFNDVAVGGYDQVPFPAREGIEPAIPLNVNMVGMTAQAGDIDLAWKLVSYISMYGIEKNLFQTHGGVPARISHIPSFIEARSLAGIEGHRLFGTPLARMRVNLRLPQEINRIIDNEFWAVWNSDKSPVEAMTEATRLANNIMAKTEK